MGQRIADGTGQGYKAKVDSDNHLHVEATTLDKQHFINEAKEESFSIVISQTPTAAGDCFLYLKNTSSKKMHLSAIRHRSASAESIQIKLGDSGTPSGGSVNTPVNRSAGSAASADATVQTGNDITGLTGGSVADLIYTGTTQDKTRWFSTLILQKNQVLSLYAVTGAVQLDVTLSIYFA